MAIIAVILLVVIVGGTVAGILLTGNDSHSTDQARYVYPQSAVNDIVSSCEKRLKPVTCECVLAAFKSTMPYDTFLAYSRQGMTPQTRAVVQAFQAKTAACPR
jgi:hypothetical protein